MGFLNRAALMLGIFIIGFTAGHIASDSGAGFRALEAIKEMPKFMFYHWYISIFPFFVGALIGAFRRKVTFLVVGIVLSLVISFIGTYLLIWDPRNFSFS